MQNIKSLGLSLLFLSWPLLAMENIPSALKNYPNLLAHLSEVDKLPDRNARVQYVYDMPFSQYTLVLLETRKAIIKRVKDSIPNKNKPVVFLVGGTGTGKSTTLCFLRGDRMRREEFDFVSLDDRKNLIGHKAAISGTLLPNIHELPDRVLVDFPGFDDTHGPLVSFAYELSLSALIKLYKSSFVVLETILNKENGYNAVAQLGSRLRRILKNKTNYVLGITKYSGDPHYLKIKAIETQQKQERLHLRNAEESSLKALIQTFTDINDPLYSDKIAELKGELAKLEPIIDMLTRPLEDTENKIEAKENLKKKENEMCNQLGYTGCLIRFSDLESQNFLSDCLDTIAKIPPFRIDQDFVLNLDADTSRLVKDVFSKSLINQLRDHKQWDLSVKTIADLEKKISKVGLVGTVCSCSQATEPIGKFLSIAELPRDISNSFDKNVLEDGFNQYERAIIKNLDIITIKNIANTKTQQKLTSLVTYILGLNGTKFDEKDLYNPWSRLAQQKANKESAFTLPGWVAVLSWIPQEPLKLFYDGINIKNVLKQSSKSNIEALNSDLDQMLLVLQQLKRIENLLARQKT